jgi:hypothetical protein
LIVKGTNAGVVATDAAVLGNRAATTAATAADKKHGQQCEQTQHAESITGKAGGITSHAAEYGTCR